MSALTPPGRSSAVQYSPQEGLISAEALTQPQPQTALAYWQAKRGARPMPAPGDIDPVEIPQLLPYITLIEVLHETPVDYRYRIEGEAMRAAIGFNRMGKRLSELKMRYDEGILEGVRTFYSVITAQKREQLVRTVLRGIGRDFYTLEIAYLPLSEDGARVDRIFACGGFVQRPEDV